MGLPEGISLKDDKSKSQKKCGTTQTTKSKSHILKKRTRKNP